MIENVELYKDTKIQLKHMSIDKDTPMNRWMRAGARYVLDNEIQLINTPQDDDYATYTMDITSDLKEEIVSYVKMQDAKIRDFWVTVSETIIKYPGEFE